jgi:hypothetical protein
MGQAIGGSLPLAVGIALSPQPSSSATESAAWQLSLGNSG